MLVAISGFYVHCVYIQQCCEGGGGYEIDHAQSLFSHARPAFTDHGRPEDRKPLVTRFGDTIDVRNRGALRMSRFAGSQMHAQDGAGRGALMGGQSMP